MRQVSFFLTYGVQMIRVSEMWRSLKRAMSPFAASFLVVIFRMSLCKLLSFNTKVQAPIAELNAAFIAQTLVWALVSLHTSFLFRLVIDRRVLLTGESVPEPAGGTLIDAKEGLLKKEKRACQGVLGTVVVLASVEQARPGTTAVVWLFLSAMYLFPGIYLFIGWLRNLSISGLPRV